MRMMAGNEESSWVRITEDRLEDRSEDRSEEGIENRC